MTNTLFGIRLRNYLDGTAPITEEEKIEIAKMYEEQNMKAPEDKYLEEGDDEFEEPGINAMREMIKKNFPEWYRKYRDNDWHDKV